MENLIKLINELEADNIKILKQRPSLAIEFDYTGDAYRYEYNKHMISKLKNLDLLRVTPRYSDRFMPPFRVGKKQRRAVLDCKGHEVVLLPVGMEEQAQMYCDYLNGV